MPSHSFRKGPTKQCWQGSCQSVHQEDWLWIEALRTRRVPARAAPSTLDLPSTGSTGAAHEEDVSQHTNTRTVSPRLLFQPKSEAAPAISLYCQGASICIMSQMSLFLSIVRRQQYHLSGAPSPCLVKKWWEGICILFCRKVEKSYDHFQ